MRLHVPISLRWSDLDAYGHVNNVMMLQLLEEARVKAFWARGEEPLGTSVSDPGVISTAILETGPGTATLTLIARQEIEYLVSVPYLRAPLDIQLWLGRLGGASLEICYEVCSPIGVDPRIVYARASTTTVLVDAASGRPRRISDAERAVWEPYLEKPVQFAKRG